VLGDSVYIGPGAKIVGAVRIGDRVAIGANCVVTKDVPDDSVVVGVPGTVISQEGSAGYINRIDYEHRIR
jgi:serine O-acetyltransferase